MNFNYWITGLICLGLVGVRAFLHSFSSGFQKSHRSTRTSWRWHAIRKERMFRFLSASTCNPDDGSSNLVWQEKLLALELLDVLSSPNDCSDPAYKVENDIRRDELLAANYYDDLKATLKSNGLSTTGDKLEMITRILVNKVDPSVQYEMRHGNIPTLEYVSDEDIESGNVVIIPEEDRIRSSILRSLDAPDIQQVVRHSDNSPERHPSKMEILDGLSRQVIFLPTSTYCELSKKAERSTGNLLEAYFVGPRSILQNFGASPCVCIWLPSVNAADCNASFALKSNWRDPTLRQMVDEIAYRANILMVMPNLSILSPISNPSEDISERIPYLADIINLISEVKKKFSAASIILGGKGAVGLQAMSVCQNLQDLAAFGFLRERFGDAWNNTDIRTSTDDSVCSLFIPPGELPRFGFPTSTKETLQSLTSHFQNKSEFDSKRMVLEDYFFQGLQSNLLSARSNNSGWKNASSELEQLVSENSDDRESAEEDLHTYMSLHARAEKILRTCAIRGSAFFSRLSFSKSFDLLSIAPRCCIALDPPQCSFDKFIDLPKILTIPFFLVMASRSNESDDQQTFKKLAVQWNSVLQERLTEIEEYSICYYSCCCGDKGSVEGDDQSELRFQQNMLVNAGIFLKMLSPHGSLSGVHLNGEKNFLKSTIQNEFAGLGAMKFQYPLTFITPQTLEDDVLLPCPISRTIHYEFPIGESSIDIEK